VDKILASKLVVDLDRGRTKLVALLQSQILELVQLVRQSFEILIVAHKVVAIELGERGHKVLH